MKIPTLAFLVLSLSSHGFGNVSVLNFKPKPGQSKLWGWCGQGYNALGAVTIQLQDNGSFSFKSIRGKYGKSGSGSFRLTQNQMVFRDSYGRTVAQCQAKYDDPEFPHNFYRQIGYDVNPFAYSQHLDCTFVGNNIKHWPCKDLKLGRECEHDESCKSYARKSIRHEGKIHHTKKGS